MKWQPKYNIYYSFVLKRLLKILYIVGLCLSVVHIFRTIDLWSKYLPWQNVHELHESDFECQRRIEEFSTDYNMFDLFKNHVGNTTGYTYFLQNQSTNVSESGIKLEVYVVPMSHVDPGWLETVDEYGHDTNKILTNMLNFLSTHPKMRFMWCEMVFFEKWWLKLSTKQKNQVKKLIANGQFEIASGSWVMTDEANPYFPVTIDNIIEGQQFTYYELGAKPTTIWSNDPFGYGSSVPYLFAQTGIKRAVINRIHTYIKRSLQFAKAIPFVWRQYFDKTGENDVYTHVLPYHHYDILNSCGPDPYVCCQFDFKRITKFGCDGSSVKPITKNNIAAKAKQFVEQVKKMSLMYSSNIILMMWGDDFRYNSISEWYQQYDNLSPLFDFINARFEMNVRFGTLSDYFNALDHFNHVTNNKPPTLSGDFFPYQCALMSYWTGYYTTRPFYKRQERQLHAFIRNADILTAFANTHFSPDQKIFVTDQLTEARRNLALFQHHDAITGTSRNHVMKDYSLRLYGAMRRSTETAELSVGAIMNGKFEMIESANNWNETASQKRIDVDKSKWISVVVFNGLAHKRNSVISLRISTPFVVVSTANNAIIQAQIEPYFDSQIGRFTNDFALVFRATLMALSIKRFYLTYKHQSTEYTTIAQISHVYESNADLNLPTIFSIRSIQSEDFYLSTPFIRTGHDADTGLITNVAYDNEKLKFQQTFGSYKDSQSGAYIMDVKSAQMVHGFSHAMRFTIKGPVQQSAYIGTERIKIKYTLTGEESLVKQLQVNMHIDSRNVQVQDELVTRFSSSLSPNSTEFYTDSNGLHLIKRGFYEGIRTAANYYPMPTSAVLEDAAQRVTFLSNVEHGASNFIPNGIEIMIDRVIIQDDGKGLGTSEDGIPNDVLPVNMDFIIIIEKVRPTTESAKRFNYHTLAAHRSLQSLLYRPISFYSAKEFRFEEQSLKITSFPCDVQLITIRTLKSRVDVRLMLLHRAGISCDVIPPTLCKGGDLTEVLRLHLQSIGVQYVRETNMNGIDESRQKRSVHEFQISLEPMDLKSYLLFW